MFALGCTAANIYTQMSPPLLHTVLQTAALWSINDLIWWRGALGAVVSGDSVTV